jgi:OTU domain-containing protein 6
MAELEDRHRREKEDLEVEISEMLAGAKSKNDRKRINQQAEKLRRELYDKQEAEREDPMVSLAQELTTKTETPDAEIRPMQPPDIDKSAVRERNRQKRLKKDQKRFDYEAEVSSALKNRKTKGQIEFESMVFQLRRLHLKMREVIGDGHCLYRSTAFMLAKSGLSDFSDPQAYVIVRERCASQLRMGRDSYFAFSGCADDREWDQYCEKVERSAEWGGELEILALCEAFHVKFVVHRVGFEPLIRGCGAGEVQLAFLQHFTTAGPHYNAVIEDASG